MQGKTIPGTVLSPAEMPGGVLARLGPIIEMTDGLSLSQVCAITGLGASTVQNWIKRGFVARPEGKKYRTRQLARILLIAALRECMRIEWIGELLTHINGNADDEADDIISEEQLYDFLCEVVQQLDSDWISAAEIPALIKRITGDYQAPDESARRRLTEALRVMICAYMSCQLKQEAARHFKQLQTMCE